MGVKTQTDSVSQVLYLPGCSKERKLFFYLFTSEGQVHFCNRYAWRGTFLQSCMRGWPCERGSGVAAWPHAEQSPAAWRHRAGQVYINEVLMVRPPGALEEPWQVHMLHAMLEDLGSLLDHQGRQCTQVL